MSIKEHMERLERRAAELQAENAKLRTFLGGGSIVTDYWKDEDGTMHVLTTDGEHTYEYMRGGLADENAKLRELLAIASDMARDYDGDRRLLRRLVQELYEDQCDECDQWKYRDRMRELGVEVTE